MKVEGLDRVLILVRDLDQAHDFFHRVLGIEFKELTDPFVAEGGMRCSMSVAHQMELISPMDRAEESRLPHVRRLTKLLEKNDYVMLGMAFRVKDIVEATAAAEAEGIRIESRFDVKNYEGFPMRNIKEALPCEEDTLGMAMPLVQYDP